MNFEYLGMATSFALGCLGIFLVILGLGLLSKAALDFLFSSVGGWKALNEYRDWKKRNEAYFTQDQEEWMEEARNLVRSYTVEPESHYTEVAIKSIAAGLADGRLKVPSPKPPASN